MHCLCPCGLTVKESCCFAKLEAYGARLEENCHGIPKPAFFTFSLGAIFLTMWVHWGLPNSWQSTVLGQSYPLLLEKSSAWQPVLSLKYKKLSKVKFLHAVNFHLAPQWGISVCPAPGGSPPMSAALCNLQTPLRAVLHELHWSLHHQSCRLLGLEGVL